ncbi:MAG TPA: valine--tRNA ligase [Erysipelotrichaceae bacterium]|nr:valine--tRNA ligase [Erysipelotrichaceae bacterium]
MRKELASKYQSKEVEKNKYQTWIDAGFFTAGDQSKDPFCLVIPPPNVTGKLHLGHAWDTTLQDIVARYKRLQGFDTLWLSGMDHAGIATQAKVEERMRKDGISRYDLGREGFLKQAWSWKEEYASIIRGQWATMGLSLDYSRERFTLDDGLSEAVKKVFVDLYNDGLIFQGERIINWDPQAKTALSNIEVIHKEIEGAFYTFAFQVVGSDEVLHVATTRPETMFGDVCVFVHPEDKRFAHLVGKTVINPASHIEMPILADDYIDIEFGTGAMKCTPAHDPNDFILGEKHGLERIICMNPDGTMNEFAQDFEGLDRFECRKQLVKRIENEGNLVKIEKHVHQVGHSERTDVIVEPYLSKQWFVKMKPLAQEVLEAQKVEDEKIHFFPSRFDKTFTQWLENIEDWCISRQLWWGHRIPAWFHKETGEIYVGLNEPENIEMWQQDEDVLDTWFSSALWPFSTLGWPENTADFKRYYPNDVLITGYDIIFFWVARMAFQARYFTKSRPFKDVLIHGLVRDAQGRKMSKSLGNGVDPMDIVENFGADALRFFLTTNSAPGQDLRFMDEKVEAAWNFINKLWNASRFVMMNLPEDFNEASVDLSHINVIDTWLLQKLNTTITNVSANMDKYEFAIVGNELLSFIWDDFCSWYIELSKSTLLGDDEDMKQATRSTLFVALDAIVKLLHPFMPFVTEEIYQTLHQSQDISICTASWPVLQPVSKTSVVTEVEQLISVISTVRELRNARSIKNSVLLKGQILDSSKELIEPSQWIQDILLKMVKLEIMDHLGDETMVLPILSGSLILSNEGVVDKAAEIEKLSLEAKKLSGEIERCKGMLSNPNFTAKAPVHKVEAEEAKLAEYERQYQIVSRRLEELTA